MRRAPTFRRVQKNFGETLLHTEQFDEGYEREKKRSDRIFEHAMTKKRERRANFKSHFGRILVPG